MSSPLDAYLQQVTAHLKPLPVKRRSAELVEIRQHLLNAVTVNKELGQSEADAAANAVCQFGTAEDLGGNLVWAWKRERRLNRRSFWGAAALMLFSMYLRVWFLLPLTDPNWLQTNYHISHLAAWMLRFILIDIPCLTLMGAGVGRLFPKRAVAAVAVVQGIIFGGCTVVFFQDNLGFARTFSRSEFDAWDYVAINFWYCQGLFYIPLILAPILGAWLVSRKRRTRTERLSHARTA